MATGAADQRQPLQCAQDRKIPVVGAPGHSYLQTQKSRGTWDPLESTCRHASLSIL